jgi:hypothetical protein
LREAIQAAIQSAQGAGYSDWLAADEAAKSRKRAVAASDQRRQWTRSMAMRDADEVAAEIMLAKWK